MEWTFEYKGIKIKFAKKFIHIKNDDILIKFLNEPGTGSMELAKVLKEKYKNEMGNSLDITDESLAVEILGHIYIEKFANLISHIPITKGVHTKLKDISDELKTHTDIIDCGEKDVDSNRYVWDSLQKFASQIFFLCGKSA